MADSNGHQGYEFTTSKREAQRIATAFQRDHNDPEDPDIDTLIEPIIVKPGKIGMFNALNRWAGHPDNG